MRSDLAKVLFELRGRTLLDHVLDAVDEAGFSRTIAVVGHQAERVKSAMKRRSMEFVLQEPQLGTGHAVQCAAPLLNGFTGDIAVLAGDVPLIRGSTLARMMEHHRKTDAAVTILTALLADATGYGRMVRAPSGRITAIVEDRDCTAAEREINEINSSIYTFRYPFLSRALPRLSTDNDQGELYLTDTVKMAVEEGERVEGIVVEDDREVAGVNTREHLEDAGQVLKERSHD